MAFFFRTLDYFWRESCSGFLGNPGWYRQMHLIPFGEEEGWEGGRGKVNQTGSTIIHKLSTFFCTFVCI